jgi:hypothetical protein
MNSLTASDVYSLLHVTCCLTASDVYSLLHLTCGSLLHLTCDLTACDVWWTREMQSQQGFLALTLGAWMTAQLRFCRLDSTSADTQPLARLRRAWKFLLAACVYFKDKNKTSERMELRYES